MSIVPPPAAIENTIMPIVSGRLRIPDSSASFSLTVWNLEVDSQQNGASAQRHVRLTIWAPSI